jgi:hypothetical protein
VIAIELENAFCGVRPGPPCRHDKSGFIVFFLLSHCGQETRWNAMAFNVAAVDFD